MSTERKNAVTKDSIVLVGSYPPPEGGCSVHVQRLAEKISQQFGVEVIDLYGKGDVGELPPGVEVTRLGRSRVVGLLRVLLHLHGKRIGTVHFHVSAMRRFVYLGFIFLAALGQQSRSILTIHSGSLVGNYSQSGFLWRFLFGALVRRFDKLIAVNGEQAELLARCRVDRSRILVIPAYLPPRPVATSRAEELVKKMQADGGALVALSGYGVPLYGFDQVLDVLERHKELLRRVCVVICTYNTYDEGYMEGLERHVAALGRAHIVRDMSPGEFSYVLSRMDLYIRATDRDGDAVAIREAGYFDVPVVASDCVSRPVGCQVYRYGDGDSLGQAIRRVLDDPSAGRLLDKGESSSSERLLNLYRDLCI